MDVVRVLVHMVVGGIVALLVTGVVAVNAPHWRETPPWPPEVLASVQNRERAEAERLGFRSVRHGVGLPDGGPWLEETVQLEAGRCLAVIAATRFPLDGIYLFSGTERIAVYDTGDDGTPVGQVQVCVDTATEIRARASSLSRTPVEWELLEADAAQVGGNAALTRGVVPLTP